MAVPLRIFIAGATGFIGRHLIKAFQAQGHEVYGLARDSARAKIIEDLGCAPIIGNLLTNGPWERAIENFDVAIGCTKPGKRGKAPTLAQVPELLKSHTDACAHLIHAVHDAKLRGIILTFDALAYGDHGEEWVSEETEFHPVGYARFTGPARGPLAHLAESRRIVTTFLMPGWVYGNGSWFKEQLLPSAMKGEARIVGTGENFMSFIHVEDLAQAYVLAAEKIGYAPPADERPRTQILNLVDDEPIIQKDWLAKVAEAVGKSVPGTVSLEEYEKTAGPLLAESITCSTRVKNQQAKDILGWKPQFPTVTEGLPSAVTAISSGK
jgi:nucleoside-diphosphate-sugar epimerase